jgi:hypothetical protein
MSSITISLLTFVCVFGGAVAGMLLRDPLPQHHLSADSKDTVKVGMGLVATMSALVLGLLVSSAKTFYDTQSAELTQASSEIILLDLLLARYGPETKDARHQLRSAVVNNLDRIWSREHSQTSDASAAPGALLFDKVQALSPKDDKQRSIQAQALNVMISLGRTRWLMSIQEVASVSKPLLVGLVFWLSMLFFSFGLFAPRNATVIAALFVAGLSVSGAILLILEMYSPYSGLIQISSAPLRFALAHLGQ